MSDASPLKDLLFADLESELATTRRVLERVPDEHLAWKPHEKSMSLGGLATHIANLVRWQVGMLRQDDFDFATSPPPMTAAPSREALLATFDANVAELRAAFAETSDDALSRDWTLRRGEHVVFKRPRSIVLRSAGMMHVAHHRGQLTVYLRQLDVPLPSVYGPTADER
jgi:uncharacterized damage-inducible protein DinB